MISKTLSKVWLQNCSKTIRRKLRINEEVAKLREENEKLRSDTKIN
jgi:hypothetical protein